MWIDNSRRAGALAWHTIFTMNGLCAAVFAAAVLLAIAPRADAFWSRQPGGSVNGAGVSGCVDVNAASSAQHTIVGFYPCNATVAEQWTYRNGQLIGVGGNCLTVNSTDTAEMDTCNATSLDQQWDFQETSSGGLFQSFKNDGCLTSSGTAGSGEQLTIGSCTSDSYWSLSGAFWITHAGGDSVNGAGVTGCLDAYLEEDTPGSPAYVLLNPCAPTTVTYRDDQQWTYKNGQLISSYGLCLENSDGTVVADTCNGGSNQYWSLYPSKPGQSGNFGTVTTDAGSSCLNRIGTAGDGEYMTMGSCTANTAAWSLVN